MNTNELVRAIHATPAKCNITTTGGGTDIFPILLASGGGSATFIGGNIPYSGSITRQIMGGVPDKLVDEPVARILAMSAFQNALQHRDADSDPIFGVATTSILQRTPDEREGRTHVIYAALQTPEKTVSHTLVIPPEHTIRSMGPNGSTEAIRKREEMLNAHVLLNLIAEGCGLEDRTPLILDADNLIVRRESTIRHFMIPYLLTGKTPAINFRCTEDGISVDGSTPARVILPGSFNPVHSGHLSMADYGKSTLHSEVHFELSIANMDKPWVDLLALEERLNRFRTESGLPCSVWVTNAPSFAAKAALFPHKVFAVGMDTAKRITDPRYGMTLPQVVSHFKAHGTKFLVFPRLSDSGLFDDDLECLPGDFRQLCLLAHGFREDVSSTKLRLAMAKPA